MPIYEIQFTVKTDEQNAGIGRKPKDTQEMFALIEGDNQAAALSSILSVWGPPGEIVNVRIGSVDKYFTIHVPSGPVKN